MSQQPHYYTAAQPGGFQYGGAAQAMPGQAAFQQSYVMLQNVQPGQPGSQQNYATIQQTFPVHGGSYAPGSQRGIGDQTMPGMQYGQGVMMPHLQSAAAQGARSGYQVSMFVSVFTQLSIHSIAEHLWQQFGYIWLSLEMAYAGHCDVLLTKSSDALRKQKGEVSQY
jgi:hypothetical protein